MVINNSTKKTKVVTASKKTAIKRKTRKELDSSKTSDATLTVKKWKKINIDVDVILKWDKMLEKIEKYVDKNREETAQQIVERKNNPKNDEYELKNLPKSNIKLSYSAKDKRNQKILEKLEKEPINIKEKSTSNLKRWKSTESLEMLYEKLDQQTKRTEKMVKKDSSNNWIFIYFFVLIFLAAAIIMTMKYVLLK